MINEDTAIIAYSTRINDMNMQDISTWVRTEGDWACAFHSENPLN